MRINQYLARCGVCSRRGADKLIEDGQIEVNGEIAVKGMDIAENAVVKAFGNVIELPESYIVIKYYKPVGVTCSEKDDHAERLIINEIKADRRLTYAGRLDRDSEGLMLLTDDGSLIEAMMRGSNRHEKEYEVTVNKNIRYEDIQAMSRGVYLSALDRTTKKCKITQTGARSFNIILTEGLNRQIRRMCGEFGYRVDSLKRIRVMNIELGNLQVGASQILSEDELNELKKQCGLHKNIM